MRYLFTILFLCIIGAANSQYTLAGYITGVAGGSTQACDATNPTTPIYTLSGTIGNDTAVYTSASGGQITDFNWRGYSATSGGAITHRFQIWGDGTLKNYGACSGGGGGSTGFAPAPTAWGNKKKPAVIIDMSRYDFFGGGAMGRRTIPLGTFQQGENNFLGTFTNFWISAILEAWMVVQRASSNSTLVKWQAYPNATSYKIYRDVSETFGTQVLIYSGTELSVVDSGLSLNTIYHYKMVAVISGVDTDVTTFKTLLQ